MTSRDPVTVTRLLAAVGSVLAAGLLGHAFLSPAAAGATDFVEYGAAARLLAAGENPYDARRLLDLQKPVGWADDKADMMWNPPWALPLVLPLAGVSWPAGLAAWVTVQALAVGWAARRAGGPGWFAVGVAMLFPPTLLLFRLGQISGFLLLGVVGFAALMRAGRPGWAGAALALTAVKPHLLLPVGVLLACQCVVSRSERKAALVGAAVLAAFAVLPLAWRPTVWADYLAAVRAPGDEFHHAPGDWEPPTLAAALRTAVGGGLLVQFLPSAVTTLALVGYWWSRRAAWDWSAELPGVVLVSVLTTGYGAWAFDLVVLVYPLVRAAAWAADDPRPWVPRVAAAAFAAGTLWVIFGFAGRLPVPPVVWWTPAFAAGYVALAVFPSPPGSGGENSR